MLDEAADQASTQAAALVLNRQKEVLKAAIKELFKEAQREVVEYILHERWIKLLFGALFALGTLGIYLKEHA